MALTKTKSVSLGRPIHIYEGTLDLTAIPYGTAAMAEQDVTVKIGRASCRERVCLVV